MFPALGNNHQLSSTHIGLKRPRPYIEEVEQRSPINDNDDHDGANAHIIPTLDGTSSIPLPVSPCPGNNMCLPQPQRLQEQQTPSPRQGYQRRCAILGSAMFNRETLPSPSSYNPPNFHTITNTTIEDNRSNKVRRVSTSPPPRLSLMHWQCTDKLLIWICYLSIGYWRSQHRCISCGSSNLKWN